MIEWILRAMGEFPFTFAVLGQAGGQHLALLVAGEDSRQVPVRNMEEMQDLGLKAHQAAVFQLHEAREVGDGGAPLVSPHAVLQVRHGEEGVRLVDHPAAD